MSRKSRFKASKWKPGTVYAVPLSDGSFCLAQAIASAMPTVIDLAVFCTRFSSLPTSLPSLKPEDLISLTATWRQALNRGDWATLGTTDLAVDRLACPNQKIIESGTTVGVEHMDTGLIKDLLNAWHGLEPWNVMFLEDYYDQMLAPGVSRPASAVILSKPEREAYRASHFANST